MRSLGRYALTEEIGRGSMGTVYKASDPLIERTVAVKTIDLAKLDDGSLEPRARFLREAKAAGRLSHPRHRNKFANHLLGAPSRFLQLAPRSAAAAS